MIKTIGFFFLGLLFLCAALYLMYWLMTYKSGHFKEFTEEQLASYLHENLPINQSTNADVLRFIDTHKVNSEYCSEFNEENTKLICHFNASDGSLIGSSYYEVTFCFDNGILIEIKLSNFWAGL